jgi:hypothetical protein
MFLDFDIFFAALLLDSLILVIQLSSFRVHLLFCNIHTGTVLSSVEAEEAPNRLTTDDS